MPKPIPSTSASSTSSAMPAAPISRGPKDLSKRTYKVVTRTMAGDICIGLLKSKAFKAMVMPAVAVGVLFAVTNPAGWLVATVAAGVFTGVILFPGSKMKQKLAFEFTTWARLFKSSNYDKINGWKKPGQVLGDIYLGALPDRLAYDGERLTNGEGVETVISVNEEWETQPLGVSIPYTTADWAELGAEYHAIVAKDHALLEIRDMERGADIIHDTVSQGKNVFVHCRGGVGRSATAIAAYLIKYQGMSPEQAANIIQASRPQSTIQKKMTRLKGYARHCANERTRPLQEASDRLRTSENTLLVLQASVRSMEGQDRVRQRSFTNWLTDAAKKPKPPSMSLMPKTQKPKQPPTPRRRDINGSELWSSYQGAAMPKTGTEKPKPPATLRTPKTGARKSKPKQPPTPRRVTFQIPEEPQIPSVVDDLRGELLQHNRFPAKNNFL